MDAVPFELVSPQIPFVVMAGEANGRERIAVLLDTGTAAPFTVVIAPELAKRIAHEPEPGASVASTGAVGDQAVTFRPAILPSFRLGPIRLTNVQAGISSAVSAVAAQLGRPIDAIVGQQFVRNRTVAIDYAAQRVDFSAAPGAAADAVAFRLAPKRPLILVETRINGAGPFVMALDSGASMSLLSPTTAAAAGVRTTVAGTLGGGGGNAGGGAQMGIATIALGRHRFDRPVAVADVLAPIAGAAGAHLDGVLGADLFLGGKITIDYKTRRLWVESGGQ